MTTSTDSATAQPHRAVRACTAAAVAVPLAGAGLAYLLWWISDRLLYGHHDLGVVEWQSSRFGEADRAPNG